MFISFIPILFGVAVWYTRNLVYIILFCKKNFCTTSEKSWKIVCCYFSCLVKKRRESVQLLSEHREKLREPTQKGDHRASIRSNIGENQRKKNWVCLSSLRAHSPTPFFFSNKSVSYFTSIYTSVFESQLAIAVEYLYQRSSGHTKLRISLENIEKKHRTNNTSGARYTNVK